MKKFAVVILLILGFLTLTAKRAAAFEAHVINVTARIELPEDHQPPEKDLSHWVLGLCQEQTLNNAFPEYSGPATDPTSGVYGVKWDQEIYKEKSGATYVIELNGWWGLGNVETAVKAGPEPATGEILGASCSLLSTQPAQPTSTDSTVLDGWKIVLLRATYTGDGKTILEYWVGPSNQDVPQTYSDIALNEFLADPGGTPESAHEWVKLYNLSGGDINVGGWVLYDELDSQDLVIDSTHTTSGSTVVPAGGILQINRNGASFSLNNAGDVVRLYNGDKSSGADLVALVRYFDSLEDKSWKRDPDGYGVWVDPPINPEPELEPEPESEPGSQTEPEPKIEDPPEASPSAAPADEPDKEVAKGEITEPQLETEGDGEALVQEEVVEPDEDGVETPEEKSEPVDVKPPEASEATDE